MEYTASFGLLLLAVMAVVALFLQTLQLLLGLSSADITARQKPQGFPEQNHR
jgi:hypothetical protein